MLAWPWFQVLTEPRVDREETITVGEREEILVLLRPELALPKVENVSGVKVSMLDARTADTCLMSEWNGERVKDVSKLAKVS